MSRWEIGNEPNLFLFERPQRRRGLTWRPVGPARPWKANARRYGRG